MKIYNGEEVVEKGRVKKIDIKDLKEEARREGMSGISTRFITKALDSALTKSDKGMITPVSLMESLTMCVKEQIADEEFKQRCLELIGKVLREEYLKILSVSQDTKTSFITISIKHHSPSIAKRWVDLIERNINISMREADMELSKNSIDFLNSKIAETNLKELKDSISKLLESQIETLMVASVDEKYVFKTISSAIIPEERSEPNRFLLVLLGLVIGFFTGSIIILVHYFLNIQKIVD